MKSMSRALVAAVLASSVIGLTACNTNAYHRQDQTSATTQGAGLGAALGAAGAGIATGGAGAIVGAVVGGSAIGGGVGYSIDQDKTAIRDKLAAAGVSVVEIGYSNAIILLLPSNVQFATASAQLSPRFQQVLSAVAEVMKAYDYTVADVPGFSDNRGSYAYNQKLSMARAEAVTNYLASQGIAPNRLVPEGYSYLRPIASNKTAAGRTLNRRVQIILHSPPIR